MRMCDEILLQTVIQLTKNIRNVYFQSIFQYAELHKNLSTQTLLSFLCISIMRIYLLARKGYNNIFSIVHEPESTNLSPKPTVFLSCGRRHVPGSQAQSFYRWHSWLWL